MLTHTCRPSSGDTCELEPLKLATQSQIQREALPLTAHNKKLRDDRVANKVSSRSERLRRKLVSRLLRDACNVWRFVATPQRQSSSTSLGCGYRVITDKLFGPTTKTATQNAP